MSYLKIIDLEFLILFSIILFLNILIINYRYKIAEFLKIIDLPNERKIHKKFHTFNWWYRLFFNYINFIILYFLK